MPYSAQDRTHSMQSQPQLPVLLLSGKPRPDNAGLFDSWGIAFPLTAIFSQAVALLDLSS